MRNQNWGFQFLLFPSGITLSPKQVQRGMQLAKERGLRNVELKVGGRQVSFFGQPWLHSLITSSLYTFFGTRLWMHSRWTIRITPLILYGHASLGNTCQTRKSEEQWGTDDEGMGVQTNVLQTEKSVLLEDVMAVYIQICRGDGPSS